MQRMQRMKRYETFLERMRAEKPDSWPEPGKPRPFNPQTAAQEAITDDEACGRIAVDDEHVMTLTGRCRGKTARIDMTEREIHVTARIPGVKPTKARMPLERVTAGQVRVTRNGHQLELTFRTGGADLTDRHGEETITLSGTEGLSSALDFMAELGNRIRARNPTGLK